VLKKMMNNNIRFKADFSAKVTDGVKKTELNKKKKNPKKQISKLGLQKYTNKYSKQLTLYSKLNCSAKVTDRVKNN
jgi:hypothetical protein